MGLNVSLTYDQESRGCRLLDRAKLSPEAQRLVLVGTGQRLDFDSVKSALLMQCPEHKAPPPLFIHGQLQHRPGKGPSYGKGGDKSFGGQSGHGFGQARKGNGKFTKKVFQTTAESNAESAEQHDDPGDDLNAIEEEDQEGETADFDEPPPEESAVDSEQPEGDDPDIDNLIQVLTVTAKKLAAITLGRKWSGQPSKNIAERKKTSCCAVCGQMGHWSGDSECPGAEGTITKGGKHKSSKGNAKRFQGWQWTIVERQKGVHCQLWQRGGP